MKSYIGDGLYAEWDGFMLTLKAPRENGEHWVGLEPEVFQNLLRFMERACHCKITVVEDPEGL